MKKIFIQDNILILAEPQEADALLEQPLCRKMKWRKEEYTGKSVLVHLQEELSANVHNETVLLIHRSAPAMEKEFFSMHRLIEAAGGAVLNEEEKILMIYRRGKWDLPKGKVDAGETIKEAAKREIEEETGVGNLKIVAPIRFLNNRQDCTYHTYELKGKQMLKATYWFKMTTNDHHQLVPQAAEGIEQVMWCSARTARQNLRNSFHAIEEIIDQVM